MAQYDLTDFEWSVIEPVLPQKSQGVPHAHDRRVVNGIAWVLCSNASWADLPERYGPPATCYNRFRRWTKAGIWKRILDAVAEAYADTQIADGVSTQGLASAVNLMNATGRAVLSEAAGYEDTGKGRDAEGP